MTEAFAIAIVVFSLCLVLYFAIVSTPRKTNKPAGGCHHVELFKTTLYFAGKDGSAWMWDSSGQVIWLTSEQQSQLKKWSVEKLSLNEIRKLAKINFQQ